MTLTVNPKFVDLSHYDDVQDGFAGAVKFGIRGVVNKVTENTAVLDHSFLWRRKPAADAGLLYGAYHFIRPGRIAQQADWFVANVGDVTGLRLVLDYETPGVSLADAQAWLERVHDQTGQWAWFYSYSAFLGERFTKADLANPFWKNVEVWIAAYNNHPTWPACWAKPIAWQYTGDGSGLPPHNVPGIVIEKGLDINSFDGSDDELKAAWLDGVKAAA